MGAAAYMMLELVEGVTLLQILKAALIPAILYYVSLFLIVHFHAARIGQRVANESKDTGEPARLEPFDGLTFVGSLATLILLLFFVSAFKAVTGAVVVVLLLIFLRPKSKIIMPIRLVGLPACFRL